MQTFLKSNEPAIRYGQVRDHRGVGSKNISLNTSVDVIRVPKHVLQENRFRLIIGFINICTRSTVKYRLN